jgi:hypothetical protein
LISGDDPRENKAASLRNYINGTIRPWISLMTNRSGAKATLWSQFRIGVCIWEQNPVGMNDDGSSAATTTTTCGASRLRDSAASSDGVDSAVALQDEVSAPDPNKPATSSAAAALVGPVSAAAASSGSSGDGQWYAGLKGVTDIHYGG